MNAKKILGIETFDYSRAKIISDITTYWKELYWGDDGYLTRYKQIYFNTP